MKKIVVIVLTSFLLLSMVACSNPSTPATEGSSSASASESASASVSGTDLDTPIVTEGLAYSLPQYPTKQESDAIIAARKIAAESKEPITLGILISPDNVADFEPFYEEWERETGIQLKTYTVAWGDWYRELTGLTVSQNNTYDVFMMCPQWVPDLATSNVLFSMNDFVSKYNPEIFDPSSDNSLLSGIDAFAQYDNNYYFMMSDTDVATLYLRKDWLEDEANKTAFKAKYGYDLAIPETLDQYEDQLEFFTNPDKGTYGAVMSWSSEETCFQFFPRMASQQVPFFNDDMSNNINSAAAVTALEEMKAELPYMMPGTLEFDAARAQEAFAQGNVYSTSIMTWAQGMFENPEISQVVGKVTYAPFPGRVNASGELVSPQCQFWGWGYSVSQYSNNPELAYLYCQWMSGAAMNARVSLTPGGWYDVAKKSDYDSTQFPELLKENGGNYMKDWMAVQTWQLDHMMPPVNAMRGGSEYGGVLVDAITAVLSGSTDAQTALDGVSQQWDDITDRYGRDEQIKAWKDAQQMYAPTVRQWLGFE